MVMAMALNPEIAERTSPRVEKLEQSNAANIAAQSWNQNDMRSLSKHTQSPCLPADFGSFELFDEQEKPLIAKVDATLDRKTGTLTATDLDTHKTVNIHVWSGNEQYGIGYPGGQGADGRYDNLHDHGPIPKGDYLIGNGYNNKHIEEDHPGGDAQWYKLYGADGKGGYSHEQLANGRGVISLHTGLESNGCVGAPSEVPKSDPQYPRSSEYNKLKNLLDNTKPFEYKPGDTFRGVLHVK